MLLISDANIFIDLHKMDLLKHFDMLNFSIATSDFVYHELNSEQRSIIDRLCITIYEMDSDELEAFYKEFIQLDLRKISYQDYSIFYFAKRDGGEVLSNDKQLRIFAKKRSIPVKGLFYILDTMVSQGIVSKDLMVEKLQQLKKINKRIPLHEIEVRIKKWTS
jgi:rRNA-processing protein FCF1